MLPYQLINQLFAGFASIEEVQDHPTKWLWLYNHERPNMANGGLPPCYKMALNPSTLDVS